MIGLTAPQMELLRFIVIERSMGREPSHRGMAKLLGKSGKGSTYNMLARVHERISPDAIKAIVPTAPDGARLRFIPVEELPRG
jgi:hypothetical protein